MTRDEKPEIIMIAAVARNGVIGRDGDMPWRLSSDLKRFKQVTMGKPMIMGRKTFQSIGKPLPGRQTIIVSRSLDAVEGCMVAADLDKALELARGAIVPEAPNAICVVGGGEIYRQAISMADRLDITHVQADVEGDTVFPNIDPAEWACISDEFMPAGERDSHDMRFAIYQRRK